MSARTLFAGSANLAMSIISLPATAIQLSDCAAASAGRSNETRVCQLQVLATYQALRYAQTRHGLTEQTCDLGADITPEALAERLQTDLQGVQSRNPDLPGIAVIVTVLSTSRKCPQALAKDFGGPTAGWLIGICKSGLKDEDDLAACAGYLGTAFEALNLTSGWKGADNFLCPSKRGLQTKTLLKLLIDEAIRDQKVQADPAIAVIATALSRKYSCH